MTGKCTIPNSNPLVQMATLNIYRNYRKNLSILNLSINIQFNTRSKLNVPIFGPTQIIEF